MSFAWEGATDGEIIDMVFSKKRADDRKEWLAKYEEDLYVDHNQEVPWPLPPVHALEHHRLEPVFWHGKEPPHRGLLCLQTVTYSDFVNKELIHFSMMDNQRSIPCIVDGLKPGQRKILFACFKRKLKNEIKVAQLAGGVKRLQC